MTTDINIINVNGLDYPIKDREARTIAESAVTMFAYYEPGLVASQAYSKVGTLIFWKDALYETTATVAKGEIWEVGVNLSPSIKAGAILSELKDELTANGNRIYMDYHDGKYGYNIDPQRGADTFRPFNGYEYLGSGTSFDVSSYPGYQNFTADNFIVEPIGTSIPSNFGPNPGAGYNVGFWGVTGGSASIVKNYDATTGVLTAYLQASASAGVNEERTTTSGTGGVKAYLLLSV